MMANASRVTTVSTTTAGLLTLAAAVLATAICVVALMAFDADFISERVLVYSLAPMTVGVTVGAVFGAVAPHITAPPVVRRTMPQSRRS